jgi:glutamyl-tRNA synthetase
MRTKINFFETLVLELINKNWTAGEIEDNFRQLSTSRNIKIGDLQMIFRVMLVGSKMGPAVFAIAGLLGRDETINRIKIAITHFNT